MLMLECLIDDQTLVSLILYFLYLLFLFLLMGLASPTLQLYLSDTNPIVDVTNNNPTRFVTRVGHNYPVGKRTPLTARLSSLSLPLLLTFLVSNIYLR